MKRALALSRCVPFDLACTFACVYRLPTAPFSEQARRGIRKGKNVKRARLRASDRENGYLVDPASSICSSQRLSHARLSTS